MGPVTAVEYESRSELYDSQLVDILGLEPENLSTEEKMAKLREYRESQYELLLDAVYKRRGSDNDSVPTVEKLRELKMDLPEVVEVVEAAKVQE
jgi:aldehyde:ferredoxin oxidoreductase